MQRPIALLQRLHRCVVINVTEPKIKIETLKIRVVEQARKQLAATWTFEPFVFEKKIVTGTDDINRAYVELINYTLDDMRPIYKWLDEHCPDRWCNLNTKIWFVRQADRTAFLLRWL
jgi:hypothetical protein